MFEHSVKVPRHYKIAANIFKKVSTEGGSVKTLLYDDKLRHFRTNVLYALITETIKHATDLDKIFESCRILETESRLDPWLAKVLTAELIFGKKALPGKSKPELTILSYKEQFEKYASDHKDDLKTEVTRRPRYVRINTNLLTTSDAIRAFQDEGYRFIRCTSGSYDDYLQQIQNLTEDDFTQDYHVKTMFVFSSGTKLHRHELYLENKIILQDKATAMAVHLLAPPSGSVALDMCAAPGMKTTQLAAYMRNSGKIYAVERNEQRFQTLCEFVQKSHSLCVEAIHRDALEIKRGEMNDVEYILLDPSCSGSGMSFCVHDYIESTRLAKLTSLQEKFLKHAMNAFPKAKRIVYSTCSLFPEENERVITNVVKTSRAKWRVQDVKELLKGQWNNFGSAMYGSMGTRCMYAKPDSDLTTGFFLAVLDRDQKDMEKTLRNEEKAEKIKRKKDRVVEQNAGTEISETVDKGDEMADAVATNADEIIEDRKKSKKKKQKQDSQNECIENTDADVSSVPVVTIDPEGTSKKKNKRSHENIQSDVLNVSEILGDLIMDSDDEAAPKKKKKKKKRNDSVNASPNTNVVDESLDVSVSKKKKKKRKRDADSNLVEDPILESESVVLETRKISMNLDEAMDGVEADYTKPKKKKKKLSE